MSQLTHPRAQVFGLTNRVKAWLAVAAVAAVAAVPALILIANDDESAQSSKASATAAGVRFDGGPDEGTRGAISTQGATRSSSERGTDTFGRRP